MASNNRYYHNATKLYLVGNKNIESINIEGAIYQRTENSYIDGTYCMVYLKFPKVAKVIPLDIIAIITMIVLFSILCFSFT